MASGAETLLDWVGPFGGLPPFDRATPEAIEAAAELAIERRRADVAAIVAEPGAPTFQNTIEPLEASNASLRRIQALFQAFAGTAAVGDMTAVAGRVAPRFAAIEDEVAQNGALFERMTALLDRAETLDPEQRRLVDVLHQQMVRRGARLAADARARLSEIHGEIARLQSTFTQNLIAEQHATFVLIEEASQLAGLPKEALGAAAEAARQLGHDGAWAIVPSRSSVWPVLTTVSDRGTRRKVREMWMARGGRAGPHDNRPVMAELLRLRREKARLLGYPSFAHLATADRMVAEPRRALELLERVWKAVNDTTAVQLAEMQAIATADGLPGPLEAHDRLYYAEKLRQSHFGLATDAARPYLKLESVLAALFEAANRLYNLSFRRLPDLPVIHPDIQTYELRRNGVRLGILWLDLLRRDGKIQGSWQQEYRPPSTFRGEVLGLSSINSSLERDAESGDVLMGWEYANVLFHEFGHALHMLMYRARYPTLGSMGVAWDMIELPSLLFERWLLDADLLGRHMRHHRTGEPMPGELIEAIQAASRFDRIFSLQLDYLAAAIIDLRLHLSTDDEAIDPMRTQQGTLDDLGMPTAIDPVMAVPHFVHLATDQYAAGVYSYLWSDVMAADAAEAFLASPGGLYDEGVAFRWRESVLSVGNTVPADEAYRNFRGRGPDSGALLRRFALRTDSLNPTA